MHLLQVKQAEINPISVKPLLSVSAVSSMTECIELTVKIPEFSTVAMLELPLSYDQTLLKESVDLAVKDLSSQLYELRQAKHKQPTDKPKDKKRALI